jgi:hypothetical protein
MKSLQSIGKRKKTATEKAPLRAGLRIRGFQLQQLCLRLVWPFYDRLRAGGAEVRQNDDHAMAVAAYWVAVAAKPSEKITLRQGVSRSNSIIKWQDYRVSASRLAESNFRYTQALKNAPNDYSVSTDHIVIV